MLYLINALGGLGRSVTDTARHAFAKAGESSRWRRLALYAAMFALPGGSIAVVAVVWARRRRARHEPAGASAVVPARPVTATAAAAAAPVCGGGQLACRAPMRRRNDA
ncbi:hypothetical protein M3I54_14050 [Paraburkholderia sp. CNPSo 3274]|uniref:hypothetical protein n=1 Tax=Paraburkholderia sp. CNPSo 3274 TaxID=2940932 RepID=UPI0020B75188|nr:hypothetical protein [Paraburkholderia sp. CNPSo 3274]MCP3708099.1 hypothetical protein [Paraburkholderia sp. CNPSo 3274]